jgi:hypothetical protein
MPEPKRLTGTVYTSLEDWRKRENGVEETWEITDDEAADLILASEPVPDEPPEAA